MNRLKSGRILSVPEADAVRATGDSEAHGVVVAHAADFNAYRNKLAGQVAAAEPVRTPQPSQSAGGKITAKVEERPTAANESQDQLRLSKAPAAGAAAGKGSTMSAEDTIAQQRAQEEAQKRVKELERNVTDLQKLATLKSKGGTEAQQNAAAASASTASASTASASTASASTASAPGASAPAASTAAQPAPQAKPAAKKLPAIKPAGKPAATEPGLLDFILDNLALVGGGAAALLLGGLLVAQRRQKKDVRPAGAPSILGVPSVPAHSLFAETGGQSIDTSNSVFNSSFAPSASQLDTNEVDPVAEADVYIAYGRDAQAEEILKEALRTHPERYPVRLKLLEIYAARKDQRAFETQAGELYSMTRGQGDEWAQAAALGLSIDPLNPLYAPNAARADADAAVATAAAAAHEPQAPMSTGFDDPFAAGASATPATPAAAAHEPMSFDQHFAGAMGTAQPSFEQPDVAAAAATAATAAAHAEPAEDEHALDFDLGGLAFEPVQAEEPKPAPAENDEHVLDFDMGGFEIPATAPATAAAAPAEAANPQAAAEEPLDFSFDMDLSAPAANPVPVAEAALAPNTDFDMASLAREFDLDPPAAPEQTSPATELKDPLFDLDAMDFGLADESRPAQPESAAPVADFAPAPAPALSLEDELFGLPELPTELPTAAPAPAETAEYAPHDMLEPSTLEADFDFGGFDLDLPGEHTQSLGDAGTMTAPAEISGVHMEMETKLDLAIAYQEIGDKEGARELLEEVIKGGNSEQVNKANAMRAQMT
jgi:pilus assembly protein FimV